MIVKQVKQTSMNELLLTWDDGHVGPVSLRTLRDACPCAGCNGETVLFQKYVPPQPNVYIPGRYDLKAAETVGGYALKFSWGDGHNVGIYTWEHLRGLCECSECQARHVPPGSG